jgi:DNA repair exonuclease SbcCD ATPase subunit
VDIAVAAVIARRTGASPQWIVLDEAFDGLDSGAKEACLEILQKHANDKLVMIVSHVSDFREFFTSSIQIQYKDGKSEVV